MRPAQVHHDYAADDPNRLADQLEEISRRAGNENPFAEVDLIFYQGELRKVIEALRRVDQ